MFNSPPPPAPLPPPQPGQRYRFGFDYALVIPTCVLFLAYLPVLVALPRILFRRRAGHNPFRGTELELELLWAVPLALLSACMWMLARWVWSGVTSVGRVVWIIVLVLAALAYPAGVIAAITLR